MNINIFLKFKNHRSQTINYTIQTIINKQFQEFSNIILLLFQQLPNFFSNH